MAIASRLVSMLDDPAMASLAARQAATTGLLAPSPVATTNAIASPVAAPAQVTPAAPVNPFTLDYNQFINAVSPYMNATSLADASNGYNPGGWDYSGDNGNDHWSPTYVAPSGLGNQWASPEGQNGSIALTLANGKTWTPSGAGSGITFVPKGTPIMADDPFDIRSGDDGGQRRQIQTGTTQEDTWTVNGDMSALLGQNDTNAHKKIEYVRQGDQLVPKNVQDWQYQSPGADFMQNVGPALAAFGLLSGGASLLGGIGGSAASTATGFGGVGTDAAVMGTGGGLGLTPEIAAQYAGLGGAVSSPVVAGAVESSVLPALAPEVAPGSGLLSGGVSTAPMGFGTAELAPGQLEAAVGTGTGASMNLLDLLPAGVKDVAQFAKDNAGLLGAIGGAIGSSQDQTQSTTQSKTPWAEAAPWMKANLATGQDLQKWYQSNPFNAQQQSAYQNLFNGVDNFNQNTMPALTDFANRGMNTAYQRQRGGAVGSGGGYGGAVQPGGLLSTGGRGFSAPQMQSLGQIDWTKVNPFAKG